MFIITALVIIVIYYLADKLIRVFKIDGFSHRYILITGCDSGFGRQLAIHLDSFGFPVFAACLTNIGQDFLSKNASSRLVPLSLDLSDPKSIQKAVDFVKQKLTPETGLWALVNNAGTSGPPVSTELCPLDGVHKTFHVNVIGPMELIRQFLPLITRCKGRIVNMSSVGARLITGGGIYIPTKFAVEGFSDSLRFATATREWGEASPAILYWIRREVSNQGVKVSILEPGSFSTPLTSEQKLLTDINHYVQLADPEVRHFYRHSFQFSAAIVDELQKKSNPDLSPVVDAYTHAIMAVYPRSRYVIGRDARFLYVPLSFMPTRLIDLVYKKMMSQVLFSKRTVAGDQ